MKHVKKKYVLDPKVDFSVDELYKKHSPDKLKVPDWVKNDIDKVKYGAIQTEDGRLFQSFVHHADKKLIMLPEPDPILIYFSNAQSVFKSVIDSKKELIKNYDFQNINESIDTFYRFYSNASIYISFLFISIEAYTNSLIPNDYIYERILKDKTERYNKDQIQRVLNFDEKIKKVIPEIMKKAFHQDHGHKHALIIKLKELRDEIIHTKTSRETFPKCYRKLYDMTLSFNHEKIIFYIKDFINFYTPDLIEECDCGQDF
jgi:hypothetical protein